VVLTNLGSSLVDLELRYRTTSGTRTWSGRLGPRAAQVIRDVVGQVGGSGSGSLEVASEGEIVVDSRTYNTSAAGTFGQYLPGLDRPGMLGAGATAWLTMLEQSAQYRTNLGFANAGATAASVTVTLYDGNGGTVGSFTVSVPAGLHVLETQPYLDFGRDGVAGGRALVTVTAGGEVMAYASVIDQRTGDATTVMPR
jgi:hypothetical protein